MKIWIAKITKIKELPLFLVFGRGFIKIQISNVNFIIEVICLVLLILPLGE